MPFSFFRNRDDAPDTTTVRVVLTEPFVRLAAGYVLELPAATGASGWDDDERLRDRLNFSNRQVYHLPDAGHGHAAELPVPYTCRCPDGVFDDVDLHSGPCRVTGSSTDEAGTESDGFKYEVKLVEINGLNAQVLLLPLGQQPRQVALYDLLHHRDLPLDWSPATDLQLDLSALLPGFYRLHLSLADGSARWLRVFKAFPLLVFFSGERGTFTTQKTLY